jgi:hypothetical protein
MHRICGHSQSWQEQQTAMLLPVPTLPVLTTAKDSNVTPSPHTPSPDNSIRQLRDYQSPHFQSWQQHKTATWLPVPPLPVLTIAKDSYVTSNLHTSIPENSIRQLRDFQSPHTQSWQQQKTATWLPVPPLPVLTTAKDSYVTSSPHTSSSDNSSNRQLATWGPVPTKRQ